MQSKSEIPVTIANWSANVMTKWGWKRRVFVFGCYPVWDFLLLQTWLFMSQMLLHSRGERGISTHALHAAFATEAHFSGKLSNYSDGNDAAVPSLTASECFAVNWRNQKNFWPLSLHVIHTAHFVQSSRIMNFSHFVFLFSSTLSSLWTLFECWPWKSERQTQADTTPGNNTGW